ncbi:MAG TPA: polysaccharide biosynthesis tyrosine autokinase [Verrucomicrobiae bacterium]|nr:polysaccharide biosynthesis tyrosine autokinase [Verrucomicrobiae bacterium]
MINQNAAENSAESVDIKEYLVVLLKRKWLVLICFLLSMALTTAYLFTRQQIYEADAKLLVTTAGGSVPVSEVTREDESRFYATQIEILTEQTMLHRVQLRMRKTPDEIRENLADLKVEPIRGAAILMIRVQSPSADFAKDFANTLCEEYMHFRDEQRAQSSENALLTLTREIKRLGEEKQAATGKMLDFAKKNHVDPMGSVGFSWYKRFNMLNYGYASAAKAYNEAKTRKELLDSRPDTSTVLALLAAEHEEGIDSSAQSAASSNEAAHVVSKGMQLDVFVDENPSLNTRVQVGPDGTINYPGIGAVPADGLTAQVLAENIRQGLLANKLVKPKDWDDHGGVPNPDEQQKATVRIMVEDATDSSTGDIQAKSADELGRYSFAALNETVSKQLFELERRKRDLTVRLDEMRKVYKPRHPALVQVEQQLNEITSEIDGEIQFIRQKADADLVVAKKNFDEMTALSKQLDDAVYSDGEKATEWKALKDDVDQIQNLYNALLSQLMKIDVSQGFNSRTVSVLEAALLQPDPVYPKKMKILLMAAFFGLGMGLALAFFIEYIDDSIKLAEEVERDLQLPFLGMIPAAQWNPDDLSAHRLDRLKQQGGVAESYRVVRSAIIFSTPREKLRSILVTSAVPREGKTTTCVNLAIGFSQVEDRVLLVDADLRRGETHKYFGFEKEKGLAEVLLGEATPEEVIKRGDVAKLDVITCGAYPANPAELLLGWRLKEFLEWAYKHYDRVVVDCPPVMGIADSAILGSAVDGVLFIIWAGRTSRRYVRVAKMTAVSRGAKVFGFVLNNLEPGRVGYYHYYPYYYSYYSRGYYYAHKEDEGKGGDIKGIEVPAQEHGKDEIDDVY